MSKPKYPRYRVDGSKLSCRVWRASAEAAWDAYVRASKRKGLPDPGHRPGNVYGDLHERFSWGTRTQGRRDGHGMVYLECET
jgi:hypothetical protein